MEPYQQLEREWAAFNSLDPVGMVVCSSGTAALHLALEAFRPPPGSEVIVPDFTMIACARAVTLAGLTPVFVDCDECLLMNTELVTGAIGSNTRVVMLVHVYGRQDRHRFIMDELSIVPATSWYDPLYFIEDLAEAHGVKPHPGSDAACWSFYRNKIVAGEEGGAVWFRDPEHAALARQLRNLGFTDAHDFRHVPRGHNYRMSNAHSKLILGGHDDRNAGSNFSSLIRYEENLLARRDIERWYDAACPDGWRMPPRDAPWVYDLRIKGMAQKQQDYMVRALNEDGIAARHGFKPMSQQDEYRGKCRMVNGGRSLPGEVPHTYSLSCIAAQEVIYLPIQPGVTTEADCRRAFEIIDRVVR